MFRERQDFATCLWIAIERVPSGCVDAWRILDWAGVEGVAASGRFGWKYERRRGGLRRDGGSRKRRWIGIERRFVRSIKASFAFLLLRVDTEIVCGGVVVRMLGFVCADDGCLDEEGDAGAMVADEEGDAGAMVAAVTVLLQGLGEDLQRDGLLKTPLRVARAFLSAMKGYQMSAEDVIGDALFCEPGPQDLNGFGGGSGGMVVVRNIDLFATCQACLLPFKICCHIAYIPSGGRVVGLSKLPRVAEIYSSRLQTPHEFADGVAQALTDTFKPLGVAVVVESWHLQWPAVANGNGITKACVEDEVAWISSRTYASKGCQNDRSKASVEDKAAWIPCQAFAGKGSFADKSSSLWDELIAVLQLQGTQIHFPALTESLADARRVGSCPFLSWDSKTSWNFPLLPTRCNGLSGIRVPTNGGIRKAPEDLLKAENGYERSVNFVPAMIAAVDSLLRAVGQDPKSQELEYTSTRYVFWLLASTQGSRNPSPYLSQKYKNSNGTAVNGFIHSHVVDFVDQLDMEMASEFSIPFCSQCEHHLLPFSGIAHVGYFHSKRTPPIERSMLLKIVQLYSRRLQVQERFTRQVAEAFLSSCSLEGVMVVVEASHLCMVLRGVKKIASTTATVATFGRFTKDVASKAAFLQKILRAKVDMCGQC